MAFMAIMGADLWPGPRRSGAGNHMVRICVIPIMMSVYMMPIILSIYMMPWLHIPKGRHTCWGCACFAL